MNKSSVSIKVGEEVTLSYKISPENVTNKNVEWLSSDSSIAIVNNGVVKGLKAGTVAISVKNGDMIATCSVIVTGKAVIKETLEPLVLNDDNKNIVAKCTITVEE